MNRQEHSRQLNELLQAEQRCLASLATSLRHERESLVSMDGAQLEASALAKYQQVQELDGLAVQRTALAGAAGFDTDSSGMEDYIRWVDGQGEPRSQTCWRQLLALLAQCQRQNQINGGAIELSRHRLQTALGLLRGQPVIKNAYRPDGRSGATLDHRNLGSA